jgi:hypothetical protein
MLDAAGRQINVGDFVVHAQAPLPDSDDGYWRGSPVLVTEIRGKLVILDLPILRPAKGGKKKLRQIPAFLGSSLLVTEETEAEWWRRQDDADKPPGIIAFFSEEAFLKQFGARKVEANALVTAPEAGRELCRQAILNYVAETAPEEYEAKLGEIQEVVRGKVAELLESAP